VNRARRYMTFEKHDTLKYAGSWCCKVEHRTRSCKAPSGRYRAGRSVVVECKSILPSFRSSSSANEHNCQFILRESVRGRRQVHILIETVFVLFYHSTNHSTSSMHKLPVCVLLWQRMSGKQNNHFKNKYLFIIQRQDWKEHRHECAGIKCGRRGLDWDIPSARARLMTRIYGREVERRRLCSSSDHPDRCFTDLLSREFCARN
jgi:hypothetical protein